MPRTVSAILVFAALLAVSPPAALAQADEKNLLAAWEEFTRNDPGTMTFEKVGEKLYRFKTSYFPFNGEMRVVRISVEQGGEGDDALTRGVISVELLGKGPGFLGKYGSVYDSWNEGNTFWYDEETGRWISFWEEEGGTGEETPEAEAAADSSPPEGSGESGGARPLPPSLLLTKVISQFFTWVIPLALFSLFVYVIVQSRKTMKSALDKQDQALARQEQGLADAARSRELAEKSLEMVAEQSRLLREILEELRKQGERRA